MYNCRYNKSTKLTQNTPVVFVVISMVMTTFSGYVNIVNFLVAAVTFDFPLTFSISMAFKEPLSEAAFR